VSTYLGLMGVGCSSTMTVRTVLLPTVMDLLVSCIYFLASFSEPLLESQGAWIVQCLEHTKKNQFTRIEPELDAEDCWGAFLHQKFADLLARREVTTRRNSCLRSLRT
jgi:hypothetical protein